MESRTSPGKTGSVQPISESLMVFAHPFPAWVSRPVVPVGLCCASSVSDGFVQP
jgi:hypothetical protein